MKTLLITALIIFLSACSNTYETKVEIKEPSAITTPKTVPNTPVFVRKINIKDKILNKRININQRSISLIDAINLPMPQLVVVAKDSEVLLNKKISIRANNQRFGDYLKQLSSASKYHITINGNMVNVASKLSMSWDLSTLSMPEPSDSDAPAVVVQDENAQGAPQLINSQSDWQSVVTQIENILGKDATVSFNERLGSVHASSTPDKIQLADNWIKELITGSQKQVFFEVAIIETTLNNSSGTGIDFSLLNKGSNGDFGISNLSQTSIAGAGIISIGTLLKTPLIFGDINLEVLLNLLKKQGQVKISNHPNILITNGGSTTLKTGNNVDYIASVDSSTDQNGNIVTTPVIKKQNTGLSIKLTAKISRDNKRITVNVLPKISAIKSSTKLATGSGQSAQEITLLDVSLTELSTQVIVRPNQSILVGGLYADNISKASKGINGDFLNAVFGSTTQEINKKEILIFLTPTLVK